MTRSEILNKTGASKARACFILVYFALERCVFHYDKDFPAHRVCSACGIISAESCIPKFTDKLAKEGVQVKGNKIQNFKQIFWNPLEEINL